MKKKVLKNGTLLIRLNILGNAENVSLQTCCTEAEKYFLNRKGVFFMRASKDDNFPEEIVYLDFCYRCGTQFIKKEIKA